MKGSIGRLCVLMLIVGVVTGAGSGLVAAPTDNPPINLELSDVDARAAIKMLFQSTGRNYAIDPDVLGTIPSLSFKDVPFDQALKSLLKSAGLVYRMDGDIYIIQKKPDVTNLNANTAPPTEMAVVETTATEETTIEKVPLNNVGASELLDMMSGTGGSSSNRGGWGGNNSWGGGNMGNLGGNMGGYGGGMGGYGGGNYGGGNYGRSSYGGGSYGGYNRSY